MAPKKKSREPLLVSEVPGENAMEIHVYGDLLHNAEFERILEVLRENNERELPKAVRFVAYAPIMLTLIRYAIPSEYYEKAEMCRPGSAAEEGMMDAAGL